MNRLDTFPNRDLIQKYRNVFSSGEASEVLYHMLYDLGLFEDGLLDPEDMALKNYASRLLRILGGSEVKKTSVDVFIKRLISQPLQEEKKEE